MLWIFQPGVLKEEYGEPENPLPRPAETIDNLGPYVVAY